MGNGGTGKRRISDECWCYSMKLSDLVRKRFGRGMLGESSPLDMKFSETSVRHCILYIFI